VGDLVGDEHLLVLVRLELHVEALARVTRLDDTDVRHVHLIGRGRSRKGVGRADRAWGRAGRAWAWAGPIVSKQVSRPSGRATLLLLTG